MDSFIGFWLLIILTTVLIVGGIIFLGYWIPKKYGKRKLGIGIAIFITLILAIPILSFVIEDYWFFKSDVIEKLGEHKIVLENDFDIESNKITGIGDYYHRFELEITENDKNKVIEKIMKSVNYRENIPEMFDIRTNKQRYSNTEKIFIVTYQDKWNYIYEFYKPNEKGYLPIWDRISVSKKENELTYERILD